MKTEWYAPLAAAFCLMLAYGSSVQPDGERRNEVLDRQVERIEHKKGVEPSGICKATDVLGRTIHNPQGETLGRITDVVFEPGKEASILYVVMSFGGFLGVGQKLFAIPWGELGRSDNHTDFVLGVPREAFERARGIQQGDWPLVAEN